MKHEEGVVANSATAIAVCSRETENPKTEKVGSV